MKWFTFWTIPDNTPLNPDCLVVLSYTVKDPQIPVRPTKAAIELAYRWWRKFPKAKIIMSTGDNQNLGITNAAVMASYAVKLGVPKKNIIEEGKSTNTYENLIYSDQIIKKEKFREIALVMFDLHARRTLQIAKKLGWQDFYWLSAYAKGELSCGSRQFVTYSRFTSFIYEIAALFYNKIKGQA